MVFKPILQCIQLLLVSNFFFKNFSAKLHGQLVSFGLQVQMQLEGNFSEAVRVRDFCQEVGLATNLSDIGVTEEVEMWVDKIAQAAVNDKFVNNGPWKVSVEILKKAIFNADKF